MLLFQHNLRTARQSSQWTYFDSELLCHITNRLRNTRKCRIAMNVHPDDLLFTQDPIALKFKVPYQNQRIDNAVDMILRGEIKASDFPRLRVVNHEGRLWSIDNRRLWVFKKAGVPRITVDLVPYNHHTRFSDLMENKPELKEEILRDNWPDVRGTYRTEFPKPAVNFKHPSPPESTNVNEKAEDEICACPPAPQPTNVNEEAKEGIGACPQPICTSDCDIPRRLTRQQTSDVEESARQRSHTKVLVGLTLVIVGLIMTWANSGRAQGNKLLIVVIQKGMSGRKHVPPIGHATATRGTAVSVFLWMMNKTFGRLIPAILSGMFRVVWKIMRRLLWG